MALSGKLHLGDDQSLLQRTNSTQDDSIVSQWKSKTHRPASFIVRDNTNNNLVLSIRGTLSPRDMLTDLCCVAEDFDCGAIYSNNDEIGKAHQGMIQAAKTVANLTKEMITNELKSNVNVNNLTIV